MKKSISKVLIANRGEIACRIIKTLDNMGIASVAIYSDADRDARHVQLAGQARHVGPSPAIESYLNIDNIINAAINTGADAIHPGYGFLSENPLFAEACARNGLIFIGPPPSAIRAMGSKSSAKRIMEQSGVPLIPGYHGDDQSDERLKQEAIFIGFPVIIKAALGGGGKGMRIVQQEVDFDVALASCRREALSSFNDDTVLIEKYIGHPRHVEIQVFCDQHGNAVHLYERDCSIQRRHQKIVEEAPAPNIPDPLREKMAHAAIQAAKAINYVGAGTVEFLYDGDDQYYFMEMNTRLQVEHPVTEMITGEDLVQWQIVVAQGNALPKQQSEISRSGHSIEVRLCAEDCRNNFVPSIGRINVVGLPELDASVRFDSGLNGEDNISIYYDPMFGKLITWGKDRNEAITRMTNALTKTCLTGVSSNIDYLVSILNNEKFRDVELSTHFLSENRIDIKDSDPADIDGAAIAFSILKIETYQDEIIKSNSTYGWRLNGGASNRFKLLINGDPREVETDKSGNFYRAKVGNKSQTLIARFEASVIHIIGDTTVSFQIHQTDHVTCLFSAGKRFDISLKSTDVDITPGANPDKHTSPMPGIITKIYVREGEAVAKGDPLVAIEAMKMEHIICAHFDGVVKQILSTVGYSVTADNNLVELERTCQSEVAPEICAGC